MGAWGYEPFDSDDAGDWIDGIAKDIAVQIEKALAGFKRGNEHIMIGAAALLLKLSSRNSPVCVCYDAMHWTGRKRIRGGEQSTLYGRAVASLLVIQQSSWPGEWDEPEKMHATLTRLIRGLRRREIAERARQKAMMSRIVVTRKWKRRAKLVAYPEMPCEPSKAHAYGRLNRGSLWLSPTL